MIVHIPYILHIYNSTALIYRYEQYILEYYSVIE